MENIALTLALCAVVVECFAFAIALVLANEFCAALYEAAPRERPRTFTRRCARCGSRFTTDTDSAFCEFCAVVVVYEHHDRIVNMLTPRPPLQQRGGLN